MSSTEYFQDLRKDLAAVCCAAAFVSQPHIWPSFTAWLTEIDPDFTIPLESDNHLYAAQMMESVLRLDRLVMAASLLEGTSDADITRLLEEET